MNKYNHKKIEAKWQKIWQQKKIFQAKDFSKKPKKYILVEFPYPSGAGLHMGHLRPYVAADVYARFSRMKGHEALFPIGWDAFGLPAENYAIKMGVHPSITTAQNVKNAKKQMQSWGLSFDWSREINTTDPNYYKWTQRLFLQFFKKGLAYEATGLINWCPKDKTGLANEEVIDGKCERCGTTVEKKELRQWYLKITAYAEKLLEGLKHLPDWPEAVKLQQENWIGKSEGLEEYWQVDGMDIKLATFTTWPHTTWGATFMVIAPEHPVVEKLVKGTKYEKGAKEFAEKCAQEKIKDPLNIEKKKDGYFLGRYVINHLTGWKMPLYIANFAIMDYGTGIVKCTPTHDQRDFEFAKKYNLDFKLVIQPKDKDIKVEEMKEAYTGEGVMVNSGKFTGMDTAEARKAIADFTVAKGEGKYVTNYKLRDWVFSRQRYWGEPIPLIHCDNCASSQGQKKKFVILHGWQETPNARFYPWLKSELTKAGAQADIPALPNSANPTETEQVNFVLKNCKFDENTVIVSHSLGTAVALKVLEKLPVKIAGLITVGGFTKPHFKDHPRPFEKNFSWEFDFANVKRNAGEVKVLQDPNDDAVTDKQAQELAKALGVPVITRAGRLAHFRAEQEPEVLDLCLNYLNKDQKANSGWIPVPDKDLPVKLPPVKKYEPTGTGESPLAAVSKWVNVKCPVCKSPAKRETNTMPQWAGSSWYWLRYTDPKDKKSFADLEKQKYWTPVDVYFGGMEHTTLHLLYSRFWNLFLFDQGLVTSREPYVLRKPHGIILAADGEKMSKSRGNVVNPQDIVASHGADTLRMFELFLGPHEDTIAWNGDSVVGVKRFLDRVWNWVIETTSPRPSPHEGRVPKAGGVGVDRALHKLIKKITEDIENFHFNTAISAFMEFHNEVKDEPVSAEFIKTFLKLLYPFAPHIAEELNQLVDKTHTYAKRQQSLQQESWPIFDPAKIVDATVEIVVQINGKVKGKVTVPTGSDENTVKELGTNLTAVKILLNGQTIKRTIFVPGRLINFVI